MRYKLTKQQIRDLIIVDPYLKNKEEAALLGICGNTIIKLRKELGLTQRKLGRPYGSVYTKTKYPDNVKKAIRRLKESVNNNRTEE